MLIDLGFWVEISWVDFGGWKTAGWISDGWKTVGGFRPGGMWILAGGFWAGEKMAE